MAFRSFPRQVPCWKNVGNPQNFDVPIARHGCSQATQLHRRLDPAPGIRARLTNRKAANIHVPVILLADNVAEQFMPLEENDALLLLTSTG